MACSQSVPMVHSVRRISVCVRPHDWAGAREMLPCNTHIFPENFLKSARIISDKSIDFCGGQQKDTLQIISGFTTQQRGHTLPHPPADNKLNKLNKLNDTNLGSLKLELGLLTARWHACTPHRARLSATIAGSRDPRSLRRSTSKTPAKPSWIMSASRPSMHPAHARPRADAGSPTTPQTLVSVLAQLTSTKIISARSVRSANRH